MSVVETTVDPAPAKTPETPSEWFDHNVRATFHSLIDNVTLRSESEATILHALVEDLDKDPTEIIAKLQVAPISSPGGYVDPVLAQVLADNASLRSDVQELLAALKSGSSLTPEAVAEAEADLETPATIAPAPVPAAPVAATAGGIPAPGADVTVVSTIGNADGSTTTNYSDGTSVTKDAAGNIVAPSPIPVPAPPATRI